MSAARTIGQKLEWRRVLLGRKLRGRLPRSWPGLMWELLGPKPGEVEERAPILPVEASESEGLVKVVTRYGDFFVPIVGMTEARGAIAEVLVRREYEVAGCAVRPGDTVIDGGAHIGAFVRYALSQGAAEVIAFEADAENARALRRTFANEAHVRIIEKGLSDHSGVLKFRRGLGDAGTFVQGASEGELVEVPVVSLDELGLARVDVIKLDVEGWERHVLRGAQGIVERDAPRLLISAYHLADDYDVIWDWMKARKVAYRMGVDRFHGDRAHLIWGTCD